MEDRWLSVSEIAEYLGVVRESVYRWLARGSMPGHKLGRHTGSSARMKWTSGLDPAGLTSAEAMSKSRDPLFPEKRRLPWVEERWLSRAV
jgi:excisionase family DNA binding protein